MKLSIIVPVFNMNHDGNLNFCLDSLIDQTIEDYEIIAVDDASSDDSLLVLREYEKKYPDLIKVITYPENRHQGGAKNEGLKVAKGEWIGFVDSDDWVAPDFYEKLINRATETEADVVGCHYSIVNEHTFEVGKIVRNNSEDQTGIFIDKTEELRQSSIAGTTSVLSKIMRFRNPMELRKQYMLHPGSMVIKVYKHEVIKDFELRFPEGIFYEDNCASRVWAAYFEHFELVNEPLYYYYQNDISTVHTVTTERCLDRMKSMDLMLEEFKRRGLFNAYKDVLEAVYAELYFKNTLFSYMLGCKDRKYAFVKNLRKGMLSQFPYFRENGFYSVPDDEERKMIDLCIKHPRIFYIYYSLLWSYRKINQKKIG